MSDRTKGKTMTDRRQAAERWLVLIIDKDHTIPRMIKPSWLPRVLWCVTDPWLPSKPQSPLHQLSPHLHANTLGTSTLIKRGAVNANKLTCSLYHSLRGSFNSPTGILSVWLLRWLVSLDCYFFVLFCFFLLLLRIVVKRPQNVNLPSFWCIFASWKCLYE